ncbi:glutamate synthase (NADPH) GltB1 subunit [Rhodoblastus acidophilus]|uniref:Glutamate synthase (NADPH) GltB1 subunit n=1 Tax=Rhodoblastus acidophilus TaxID=1074 RepID=A0A212QZ08_RHOAC|nr:class II glutamine amidotransferase [Rhodoblastus acidophilus]PPQ40552.1 amidophosphoribosyltransferase [Rhodoblastus acidophilus]RAI20718.1 amidophosphoribosyltransferase [Rhodoblastus acidophilus]SNB64967.1 glutamate synthase (NADPH) GltB1 subunit [Rhodoblastus acidophilus]
MCGIAGIFFKKAETNPTLGQALVDMLDGCQHRGLDSTGFALYENTFKGLRLRFIVDDDAGATVARVKAALAEQGAKLVNEKREGASFVVEVEYDGEIRPFAYAMEHAAKLVSIGSALDIIKDVGTAHDLDRIYGIKSIAGSHGVGHVRLATESEVKPEAAHPFWATGFSDVAIVHNGQITNYWKMRRRLEARGFEFRTDNDSELIAVYLADKLAQGETLELALEQSVDDLDGVFSFLVSTKDGIGFAKDRLAAKPMVMFENDDLVAIASEEVSLNRLFPGRPLSTTEPAPGTFRTWSR